MLSSSTSGAVSQSYSLLQLSGTSATGSQLHTREDLARIEVVTLVKRLAKEHHSAALAQLASRIAATLRFSGAGQDPFGKVKGMIAEMITKLESEAGKDATEKAYCDEQMSKTEEKKGELDHTVDKLTSKIDTSTAKLTTLKREVKELQAELATLTSEQAEMDKVRRESHADYSEAKTDLEAGLAGVRQALGMLREYYGSAAAAAAMIQNAQDMRSMMQQPSEPEYHSKASGAGTSIIGLLEVVESDFSKNLSAEEMQEEDAATSYEATSQKNKVTKTMKEQDVTYKTKEAAGLEKSLGELSGDRESAATEMSAVLEYYSKIKDHAPSSRQSWSICVPATIPLGPSGTPLVPLPLPGPPSGSPGPALLFPSLLSVSASEISPYCRALPSHLDLHATCQGKNTAVHPSILGRCPAPDSSASEICDRTLRFLCQIATRTRTRVSDVLAYADHAPLTGVRHLAVAARQTRMSEERRMRWPKSVFLNNMHCVRASFASDRSDLGLGGVGVSVEVGSGASFYDVFQSHIFSGGI